MTFLDRDGVAAGSPPAGAVAAATRPRHIEADVATAP